MSTLKCLKIAMYLPAMESGGTEKLVLLLTQSLLDQGHEVTILLDRAEGSLLPQIPTGAEVVTLDVSRTIFALPKLASYLRKTPPDILVSHLGHNNIIALWAARIVRTHTAIVICQHNTLSSETKTFGNWQHRLLPSLYRKYAKQARSIVAVSEGVADDMSTCAGIRRSRISVIHNPVVSPDFGRLAAQDISHPWFLEPAGKVFVAVGRLVPQKDFSTLISAFSKMHPGLNAKLLILGEGPLLQELVELARSLGISDRVDFVGFQPNPLPYLRQACALVMTSRFEGFGNVLVEALACGTPVISTECPHGPAEILEHGRFGTLVPVGDACAVAEAMARVITDRPDPRVLKIRASAFSTEGATAKYLALFQSACALVSENEMAN